LSFSQSSLGGDGGQLIGAERTKQGDWGWTEAVLATAERFVLVVKLYEASMIWIRDIE
jgi:hypothetical protein